MLRKIDKMHSLFGVKIGEQCKNCYHLKGGINEYRKCEIYGKSASEATDWALKYTACGLFNEVYQGDIPIVKLITHEVEDEQIEGQMNIMEFLGEGKAE